MNNEQREECIQRGIDRRNILRTVKARSEYADDESWYNDVVNAILNSSLPQKLKETYCNKALRIFMQGKLS